MTTKKYDIMYIESKSNIASLEANIGKVFFSKTGKTLKYGDREFQSLKGAGSKANYFNIETMEEYWISGCRRDGNDGLYKTTVFVDENIREEYWVATRKMPERKDQASFTSSGKHQAGGKEIKNWRDNT